MPPTLSLVRSRLADQFVWSAVGVGDGHDPGVVVESDFELSFVHVDVMMSA
jgi:hypothetical protein